MDTYGETQTQPGAGERSFGNPLISSSDVNGTAVYSTNGDRIGSIDHLMIDKSSGRVAYAVMGSGGFLGIGSDYTPVPWDALKYDTALEGYVTGITVDKFRDAPERSDNWQSDRDWEQRTWNYYGLTPYWV